MERDLSNVSIVQRPKEIGGSDSAKSVIPCIIDGVDVIIKTHSQEFEHGARFYNNEKNAYLTLQNENFVPKLLYFDDKNLKLCMTDVGEDLSRIQNINHQNLQDIVLKEDYHAKLINAVHIMNLTYNIYHNDLKFKNICIDKNNELKLIDFDRSTVGPHPPVAGFYDDDHYANITFLENLKHGCGFVTIN